MSFVSFKPRSTGTYELIVCNELETGIFYKEISIEDLQHVRGLDYECEELSEVRKQFCTKLHVEDSDRLKLELLIALSKVRRKTS